MNEPDETRDPVEELAEDFIVRHRRGERPSVDEYAEAHPTWAERIRSLFPALLILEGGKSDSHAPGNFAAEREEAPQRLGDFRILREIGRGGMGVVYEAEQESLGRRVALKVLPASYSASSQVLRRFRREAQAAARLHHTNIVSVFGVGHADFRHFYVMQFIEGQSLDRVLTRLRCNRRGTPPEREVSDVGESTEELHGLNVARAMLRGDFESSSPQSGGPSSHSTSTESGIATKQDKPETPELPDASRTSPPTSPGKAYWRSVAGVGAQAADALHYAHRQGTLHRDMKPGNLLLDDQGTVWITDFGLAKLIDEDDLTHSGDVVGTLRYMAPEQLDGKCDARSDVYSLGLTLYELLTLRPAFDETSRHKLIRQVGREAPARPRAIDASIPRDLETIVLKAITRDPKHRYRTAGELSDDLGRFLEDRPIRARRTSPLEHAWRWCRRNPTMAVLTASTLLLLIATVVGTTSRYYREAQLRAQEEQQRERAEANLELAADAFEEVFSRVSGEPLQRAYGTAEDEGWVGGVGPATVDPQDALILEGLLKFYDQFARQNQDSERWRRESAQAYRRMGDIQQRLGRFREAIESYARASASYESLLREFPEKTKHRLATASLHNQIGNAAMRTGEPREARQHFELARTTLKQTRLPERLADERDLELAEALRGLGFVALIGRFSAPDEGPETEELINGETHSRQAVALLVDLAEKRPTDDRGRLALAECHMQLWAFRLLDGRDSEAAESKSRAIAILDALLAEAPDDPDYQNARARMLAITSHPPFVESPLGSVAPLQEAAREMQRVAASHPHVPDYRRTLGELWFVIAKRQFVDGHLEEAKASSGRALELFRSLRRLTPNVRFDQVFLARSLYLGAVIENAQGHLEPARDALREAVGVLDVSEESGGRPAPFLRLSAKAYVGLADLSARLGEAEQAAQWKAKAERLKPPPRPISTDRSWDPWHR